MTDQPETLAPYRMPWRRDHMKQAFALAPMLRAVPKNPLFLVGAAVIPPWRTKTEVEEGDDMGMVAPSAAQLGLAVQYEIDQLNPNYGHEEVISITPPAGTLVMKGSTVVVRINLEG